MSSFEIPEPIVKLELGGKNYGLWACLTRVTLQARGLWGHITGKSARPPTPDPPPRSPANAAEVATDAAASKAFQDYQSAFDAYGQWASDDARTMLFLIHSVEAKIVHLQLESAQQMWAHLRRRYQPTVDALHYSLLQQLRTLKQGGDTVDTFFDRFMDLWGKLESLVPLPDVCRECACCVKRRQHNDKRELYEFLIRLRPEFGPAKTWLLGCSPLPSVIEARNALLIEEIRLQSAAPVVAPAEKKKRRKKKHSGGHPKLKSSEPSESSSSLLSQNVVAGMVNRLQGLTHQESSGSTNLPSPETLGSDHDWDCLL